MLGWIKNYFNSDKALVREEIYSLYIRKRISDYLMPSAYDADWNVYYTRDNMIGIIFECYPKPVAGEETVKLLDNLYSAMYLPDKTTIQVILWGSDFMEPFINYFTLLRNTNNQIINEWVIEYAKQMNKMKRNGIFDEVPVPLRDFRLLFVFKIPFEVSQLESKTNEIQMIYSNIKTSLESLYLFPDPIMPDVLINIMSNIINPNNRDIIPTYDPEEYIFKQVVDADNEIEVYERCIKYNKCFGKALTIKQYPEEVSIIDSFTFIGDIMRNEMQITCPFMLTLNLYIDHNKLKDIQEQKAEMLYKQKLASSLSVRLEKKQDESKWMMEKIMDGNRLCRGNLTWWFYHDDIDVINRNAENVKNLVEIRNFKLQTEIKTINLALFLYNIIPFGNNQEITENLLKRAKTMFCFNAAHLTPVQADWKGTGTPIVKFISRRGQDMSFNLFDGSEGFNGIIAAQTGSGKSFVTNHIIFSYYSLDIVSNIWVVDIGESYKYLCNILGGQYLDFREDGDFIINPFSDCDNLSEDMDLFVGLISKMAKPTDVVSDTEKSVIEEAIYTTYKEYERETNIDKIIETLYLIATETEDFPKKNAATVIATNLFRWSSKGSYGKFFNGKNNINLSHKLVVLELKNISHKEDLRNVVLMVLFYHISKVVYQEDDRSKRKLLIFDEAWQFFDDVKVAKFIEKAYRTFRKHGSSAITVTQGVNNFYANDSTKEMMFQASYWILLKQKAEAINLLRKEEKISLSEMDFHILESIRTIKGKYSELYFVTPLGRGVGRLIIPRKYYWIYTTDPEDARKRNELIEQYGVKEGLEKCIEMYG